MRRFAPDPRRSRVTGFLPALLAACALPLLFAACTGPPGEDGAAPQTDASVTDASATDAAATNPAPAAAAGEATASARTYTVRGVVRRLPDPEQPGRPEVYVLHEAIPDFVSSTGHETGMQGMTMPFPLADGVSLQGIDVGAWVEITFQVDWEGSPPMLLTAIRLLDPEDP